MAIVKEQHYQEMIHEDTLFSVDNTVDLMNGSIEVLPNSFWEKWCRVNIGELSCGVLRHLMDDVDMWVHEFIEYSLFMLGKRMGIPEFWRNFPIMTPAHTITSLLVGAWRGNGTPISPEKIAERYGFPELEPMILVG
jgi:hypothetical protein